MKIESYDFGNIVVDGKSYGSDVLIYPDKVDASWWRKQGHYLHMEDLKEVLEAKPEVLIIGTGYNGIMKVPQDVRDEISGRNIDLYIEKTIQAVSLFNELAGKKRVFAALHLTC